MIPSFRQGQGVAGSEEYRRLGGCRQTFDGHNERSPAVLVGQRVQLDGCWDFKEGLQAVWSHPGEVFAADRLVSLNRLIGAEVFHSTGPQFEASLAVESAAAILHLAFFAFAFHLIEGMPYAIDVHGESAIPHLPDNMA